MGEPLPASTWLASSFSWCPATLQAAPAKAAPPKKSPLGPVCQVEGCGADLSDCRPFFKKQRICQLHARADVVTDAAGRQLRFCQQCTRLEPLSNFSSGRRSCRTSLAKRQARAHRGKAISSPDSSPERGTGGGSGAGGFPGTFPSSLTAASSDGGSQGTSSAKGGNSHRSGSGAGGGPSSKRSRGSSPSRSGGGAGGSATGPITRKGGAASAGHAAVPAGAQPSSAGGAPNSHGGSSRLGSPMGSAHTAVPPPLYSMAADNAAAGAAAAAALAQAQAQQQQQQQHDEAMGCGSGEAPVVWSNGLMDNIEELLAMDPDDLADALLVPGMSVAAHTNNKGGSSGSDASQWLPSSSAPALLPAQQQQLAPMSASWPLQQQQQQHSMPQLTPAGTVATASPGPLPVAAPTSASFVMEGTPSATMLPRLVPAGAAVGAAGALPAPGLWPAAAAAAQSGAPMATDSSGGGAYGAAMPPQLQAGGGGEWAAQPEAAQAAAMQQDASGAAAAVQIHFPSHVVMRFSLKIFGVDPQHLPPSLRAELLAALQVSPTVLEGAIRCGCTHLIADILLSREEQGRLGTAPRLAGAVQHMRAEQLWRGRDAPPAIVAQMGALVALGTASAAAPSPAGTAAAAAGDAVPAVPAVVPAPLPCIHLRSAQLLPRLRLACPIATTTAASRGMFHVAASPPPSGSPAGSAALAAALRCRCHGQLVGLAVSKACPAVPPPAGGGETALDAAAVAGAVPERSERAEVEAEEEEAAPAAAAPATLLEAWAPAAAKQEGWGLYEFEVASGSLLSEAVPVLVLPDELAEAAAELCQLQQQQQGMEEREGSALAATLAASASTAAASSVVRLVAAVLRYLTQRQAAELAGPGSAAAEAFAAAYPPPAAVRLAAVAQQLVAFAVRSRWPAVAALVLPAVTADGSSAAAAAQRMDALSAPAPTALHLAIASGSAASLSALHSWAAARGFRWADVALSGRSTGSSSAAAEAASAAAEGSAGAMAAEPATALMDPLLLAASMGSSLRHDMVQQLTELLGPERFARSAVAAGPGGWSPRRVALSTGNAALLAAFPPEHEAAAAAAAAAAAPQQRAAAGEQRDGAERGAALAPSLHKLRGLDAPPAAEAAAGLAGAGACLMDVDSPAAEAAVAHAEAVAARVHCKTHVAASGGSSKLLGQHHSVHSSAAQLAAGASKAPAGRLCTSRLQPQEPSHDAALLEELLEEMNVPPEPAGMPAGVAWAPAPAKQLLATSLAGAAVAALAALAVRYASP